MLDALVAIVVLWLIIALPGPLAISAGMLLALWSLSVAGVVQIEGIPINLLIVLVILVGTLMHLVTHRRRA